MGSNVVSLMDRAYMLRLQARILEDYGAAMDKRIKVREVYTKYCVNTFRDKLLYWNYSRCMQLLFCYQLKIYFHCLEEANRWIYSLL